MFHGMEYIYEVYKAKSFSKAASNLYISQPSLSANVKRIEDRIGYPLFDRGTKPLKLTEYGEYYVQTIEKILASENEFADYLSDLESLKTGHLAVGGSNFFSSWILPPLVSRFAQRYPGLHIELLEETTTVLTNLLQSEQVDLVLDNKELNPKIFDSSIFTEEYLLLAVPLSFPVNQRLTSFQIAESSITDRSFMNDEYKSVNLHAFDNLPFIMLKPSNDTGSRAISICQENNFSPLVSLELDQQMTAFNVASSGLGITFVGDLLVSRVPFSQTVALYKLSGSSTKRTIKFYWKRGRYFSKILSEFLLSSSSI
jgi:DNA-binding transcriptional LysR family regulator